MRLFKDSALQTNLVRSNIAFFAGALVGATIAALQSIKPTPRFIDPENSLQYLSSSFFEMFVSGIYFWLTVLAIFGIPAWILAHFKGYRGWGSAVFAGYFIPFLVFFAVKLLFVGIDRINIWSIVMDSTEICIPGALVSFTIWRVAYRRPQVNA